MKIINKNEKMYTIIFLLSFLLVAIGFFGLIGFSHNNSIETLIVSAAKKYVVNDNVEVEGTYYTSAANLASLGYLESNLSDACLNNSYVEVQNNNGELSYSSEYDCGEESRSLFRSSKKQSRIISPVLTYDVPISYVPEVDVTTKGSVVVSIKFNESIGMVAGWNITEEGEKYVLSKEFYENTSKSIELKVFSIDGQKSATVIIDKITNIIDDVDVNEIEVTPSSGYAKEVVLKLTANEDIELTNLDKTGFTIVDDRTITYKATENKRIVFEVEDKAGNKKTVEHVVGNVDNEVDVNDLIVTPSSGYAKEVILTLTANEDIELTNLDKTGFTIVDDRTITYKATENKRIVFEVKDKVGNTRSIEHVVGNVDNEVDVNDLIVTPSSGYAKEVVLKLTANEDIELTNLDKTGFTIVDDRTITYKATENKRIVFEVKDELGNTKSVEHVVGNVDEGDPVINYDIPLPNDNGWYNEDIIVTVSASDSKSGVKHLMYRLITSTDKNPNWVNVTNGKIIISENNENVTLEIKAIDDVGNDDIKIIEGINLDKDSPIINLVLDKKANNLGWYTTDVEIKVNETNPLSDIETLFYQISYDNGLSWSDWNNTQVNSENDLKIKLTNETKGIKYNFKVIDESGNESNEIESNIIKIDKFSPSLTITEPNGKKHTEDFEVILKVEENRTYELSYDKSDTLDNDVDLIRTGNINTNKIGNYEVTYDAVDDAGNKTTIKIKAKVVDKTITDKLIEENDCDALSDCYNIKNENNYVWYSGHLWRIIKINKDETIKLIMEDSASAFSYDDNSSKFSESNAYDWLNTTFYNSLNNKEDLIVTGKYCNEKLTSLASVRYTCNSNDIVESNVGLLTIDEYNIIGGKESYLNNGHQFFTMTPTTNISLWVVEVDGDKDGGYQIIEPYALRPVITLKALSIGSGSGTMDDPYRVNGDTSAERETDLNKRVSGEYVCFADKVWRVVSTDETSTKLILDSYLTEDMRKDEICTKIESDENIVENEKLVRMEYGSVGEFSTDSGIGKYLNETVYNSMFSELERSVILNSSWNYNNFGIGQNPNDEKFINGEKYTDAYVGLIRVGELMSGSSITSRIDEFTSWTLNSNVTKTWFTTWAGTVNYALPSTIKGVKPVINLNDSVIITSGDGTYNNPYKLSY